MTRRLSMSMFASKEDLLEAKLAQLEADKAALMELARVVSAWRLSGIADAWAAKTEICRAFSALPAHLKEAAKEEER